MSIVASSDPRIVALDVTKDAIVAQLADGRSVSVPLAWSWRLAGATPAQRVVTGGAFDITVAAGLPPVLGQRLLFGR